MIENNQNELEDEKRRRQLAILKASNQMLIDAKEKALSKTTDKIRKNELEQQFQRAIDENKAMATNILHATMDEVNNSKFRDADEEYVEKYKRRLEKRGITDEEMHRKDSATVTTNKEKKKNGGIPRRERKGKKKNLGDIERIENEEELMKKTMVTDDKQIQDNIEKNLTYEQEELKSKHDKFASATDNLKKSMIGEKVSVNNVESQERVKVETKKEDVKTNDETIKTADAQPTKKKKRREPEVLTYDFDFGSIPSYVQYDVIPLPSNGQCYPKDSPLRCGRIPVAYLTASDENIIASPNVYRDGKLLDIILSRKVLDKRINVNDIVSGDKDAIILWLRATSYGDDFPITATDPKTGKQYDVTIKLSQFDYYDFDIDGDEDGLFDFNASNGDVLKYKFFTTSDETELRQKISSQITDNNKFDILKNIGYVSDALDRMEISDDERDMLTEDIDEIKEIVGADLPEEFDEVYPNTVTEQMIMHTVSINGNKDREFIKNYIENMRTKDSMEYRKTFIDNRPGVDFNFNVNIPESDGGGSFATFLRIDDTIFINF